MMVWSACWGSGVLVFSSIPKCLPSCYPSTPSIFSLRMAWRASHPRRGRVRDHRAEALYVDMAHSALAIQLVWFSFVLPALVLNYLGQGALLLANPEAVRSPFFLLAPHGALYPMIGLATVATVIASQAVISGAFESSARSSRWVMPRAWPSVTPRRPRRA